MPTKIRLNGADHETQAATAAELVQSLALPAQAVLLERNGAALTRAQWSAEPIREGDRFEILRVAAGG